jgi:hypothetical protein
VAGPWTLAASTWLPRGERVASDPGATRDLVDSLAEGIRGHVAVVQRLVPGASLVLQLDEPSLPAVVEGRLPTASGYGLVRAVDPVGVVTGLQTVLAAAPDGSRPVVHCCAPDVPVALLRRTGTDLAVDTALLGPRGWEGVAVGVEDGMTLYAGCVSTAGPVPRPQAVVDQLLERWRDLGMPLALLDGLVVSPACGLAALTPNQARDVSRVCIDSARELTERTAT